MNCLESSKIKSGLFIFITLILFGFYFVPVGALSTGSAAQGMQISPTIIELNAARGKTYDMTLTVVNITVADLVYNSSIDDFKAADETGSPHVVFDSKLPAAASVKTWIKAIPQFTLRTKQAKVVTARITIPSNAEPGGHYGVIRFSGTEPKVETTGVGLSASAGTLLLIRVDGNILESANLASFYTSKPDKKQSSFFENSPITFVTRIKNDGNIHIKPIGNIEVRDMFGNQVVNLPVNKTKSNVLPNSIRRFEEVYNKKWLFGLYTANLTLGYGTTGQAITRTIKFWVIPYKIILTSLLILITVAYVIARLIKVYNRHIIEKSKNENKKYKKNN